MFRRVRRLLLPLIATFAACALPAAARAGVAQWEKGVTFAAWWRDEYTKPETMVSFNQLVATQAQWVAVVPAWMMKNKRDSSIFPVWDGATASDDSLRYLIGKAHARGLKVMLKPHVDQQDKTWRGEIQPADPRAWFSSYRKFLFHYAILAADTRCEQLCIGTELKTMTVPAYADQWRWLIADVRRLYPGKLTYAANWGLKPWAEYYQIPWWGSLDYIGVDAYFPLVHVLSPSVAQVMAGWRSYADPSGTTTDWVADMKAISQRFRKPVIFTEIGFESNPRAGNLWHLKGPTYPDMAAQSNCVEATFRVFDKEPWVAGVFWWNWGTNPNSGGPGDTGMDLNRKPAAQVLAKWFARGAR